MDEYELLKAMYYRLVTACFPATVGTGHTLLISRVADSWHRPLTRHVTKCHHATLTSIIVKAENPQYELV